MNNNQELLEEIQNLKDQVFKLKKRKKYGLVWEDKPELFDAQSQNALPVLVEKGGKFNDIIFDKNDDFNILIEGDNYHALSVLKYTHRNKIDVIYIDPPYNTGNKDFIYNDHFIDKEDTFRHSKWLSFMSKRLKLAKSLLKNDGVIFISIDDNEQAQLKMLCDSVLGEENHIITLTWTKKEKASGVPPTSMILPTFEYILVYSKKQNQFKFLGQDRSMASYKIDDDGRYWRKMPLQATGNQDNFFDIIDPKTNKKYHGNWAFSQSKILEMIDLDKISFPELETQKPTQIVYADEMSNSKSAIFSNIGKFDSETATKQFKEIFKNKKVFDFPKPLNLISFLLSQSSKKDSKILDFMAGSGTTGHAALDLNKKDGGKRKFILCTNNENNICEDVTYERIKRVSHGYTKQNGDDIDGLGGNLKYLKTDFIKVDSSIDDLKEKIVEASTEIICLKENTFAEKDIQNNIKVFENTKKYTAILFDTFYLDHFIKIMKKLTDKHISIYVFSYDKDFSKEEFGELSETIDFSVEPIPEKLLETYQDIFNF